MGDVQELCEYVLGEVMPVVEQGCFEGPETELRKAVCILVFPGEVMEGC